MMKLILRLISILTLMFFLDINNINSQTCNDNEVYHEKFCYTLIFFKSLLNNANFSLDCLNKNNYLLESCKTYSKQVIARLINIYTSNLKLTPVYQFAFIDTKTSQILLERLSEKTNIKFNSLFVNSYSFDSVIYIENQSSIGTEIKFSSTNINNDNLDKSSSANECVYGSRANNTNKFFFGNCQRKLPFICMKHFKLNLYNPDYSIKDGCAAFNVLEPGGNWLSCQDPGKFNITKTQSCCMFNAEWMETFSMAKQICTQFNSHLYSLEVQSYEDIPVKFASYLKKGINEQFLYWTSCWKTNVMELNGIQKQCAKTTNNFLKNGQRDFFINIITKESNKHNNLFDSGQINVNDLDELTESNSIHFESMISVFNLTKYAFIGRKSWSESNFTTRVFVSKIKRPCFLINTDSTSFNFSLPIFNKCHHMTLTTANLTDSTKAKSIYLPDNIISSLFSTLEIFQYQNCTHNISDSSGFLILVNKTCYNVTEFRNSTDLTRNISKYLLKPRSALILHSYDNITGILELTCLASAFDVIEKLEECLRFYLSDSCRFSCPRDCNTKNDVNRVWQTVTEVVGYLGSSSICQAAYHSNILVNETGHLILNKNLTTNTSIIIKNNGITANIWPLKLKKKENLIFQFKNNFTLKNLSESNLKKNETLVLIQAVFKTSEISEISAVIYNSANVSLKQCIFDHEKETSYTITHFSGHEKIIKWSPMSSQVQRVNTYYEFSSVKFPVNIIDDFNQRTVLEKHAFRFNLGQNFSIKLQQSITPSICHWYFNELNTGLNCSSSLKLIKVGYNTMNDPINQMITIHAKLKQSKFKLFSRIYLNINRTESRRACPASKFGKDCKFTCPNQSCKGYLLCARDPYGCSCLPGFAGYACNETCEDGRWGIDCNEICPQKCKKSCDIYTGVCNETKNSLKTQERPDETLEETCCPNRTTESDCKLSLANKRHELKINLNTSLVTDKTIRLDIKIEENIQNLESLFKISFCISNTKIDYYEAPMIILNNSGVISKIFHLGLNQSDMQIETLNQASKVYGVFFYNIDGCLIRVFKNLGLVKFSNFSKGSLASLPTDSNEKIKGIQIWLVTMLNFLLIILISILTKIYKTNKRCKLKRLLIDSTVLDRSEFSWLVPTKNRE